MPKFLVTYDLSGAWEQWAVEADEGVSIEDIETGAPVNFLEMTDSGNGFMTVSKVEEF